MWSVGSNLQGNPIDLQSTAMPFCHDQNITLNHKNSLQKIKQTKDISENKNALLYAN
jgi:hypothetical protein